MDPPTTPPYKFSTVSPGLLTSKDLMIINLGEALKFLFGIGINSVIY